MIKNWYNKLSNPTRAAFATTFFTFLATVGLQLLGLLQDISRWLDEGVQPDWDTAAKLIISAAVAAASGIVNYAVRYFQTRSNPSAGPQYHNI